MREFNDDYILVPIAIREDERVHLRFPKDITEEEAEKVARVIRAYAVPSAQPLPHQQNG